MDVSVIANAVYASSTTQAGDAVQMTVLKKALQVEAQGAEALINALPQPFSILPAHLGQHIDTVA